MDIRDHLFVDITRFYEMLRYGGVLDDAVNNDLRALLLNYKHIQFKRVWLVSPYLLDQLAEASCVGFEYLDLQFWFECEGDMDRLKATWNY